MVASELTTSPLGIIFYINMRENDSSMKSFGGRYYSPSIIVSQ